MTSTGTKGKVLLHLTVPQEHQKNLFSITHGIPTIVVGGGAGLSGFQAITSSLHAVTMDTENGICVEHSIVIGRNRAAPEMAPTRTQAYDLTPIREQYSRIFLILNCSLVSDLPLAACVSFRIE